MSRVAKVLFVVDVKRDAGNAVSEAPPKDWVGKEVSIWRSLRGWHAHWVERDGEKFVMSHAELYDDCKCKTCEEMRRLNIQNLDGIK